MQIVACTCPEIEAFIKDAFPLVKPDTPLPPIYHNILQLTNPTHIQMVNALEAENKKYALLFTETEVWDLKTGVQIA